MRRFNWFLGASLVAMAAVISAPAARAEHDISFGVNTPIGNDGNLFLSISSRHFNRDAGMVTNWARRYRNPDDLAVFLYICSKSSERPEGIDFWRRKGLSWYDVGVRAGIPIESYYVVYDRPPARGRYGRPYGEWNRRRQNPRYVVRLTDREVRDLVAVKMAHEYYGVTPEIAMNWRRSGASTQVMMTREYRTRHRDDDRRHDDRRDGRRDNRRDRNDDRPGGRPQN